MPCFSTGRTVSLMLAVVLLASSGCTSSEYHSSADADNTSSNPCFTHAVKYASQASKDQTSGDYKGGYKNASTSLSLASDCPEGPTRDMAMGVALLMRAGNERHLSVGSSDTDMNQAIQLFMKCTADPAAYGTTLGGDCQTWSDLAVKTKTGWEMSE